NREVASPVRVDARGGVDPARIGAWIASDTETGRSVALGQADVATAGVGSVPVVGYDGDSTRVGYALISGRWFARARGARGTTHFFAVSGLSVGDSVTISHDGRSVTVTLVGEVFDTASKDTDNLGLRGTWADLVRLDPAAQPDRWEIQPAAGTEPRSYAN